jgi:hypothetical protein
VIYKLGDVYDEYNIMLFLGALNPSI